MEGGGLIVQRLQTSLELRPGKGGIPCYPDWGTTNSMGRVLDNIPLLKGTQRQILDPAMRWLEMLESA